MDKQIQLYLGDNQIILKQILEYPEWSKLKIIDIGFGYWLSGFVDGEGCFRIHRVRQGDYYECHFQIKLRKDDRSILEKIQEMFGFGRIQDVGKSGTSNPASIFVVVKREDCFKIAKFFIKFPLRAKKQRDFYKWCEALLNWKNQKRGNRWYGKSDVSAIRKNWIELKKIREYKEEEF